MPALWKLDVDSAFRRVPLAVMDRWAAAVTFMYQNRVSMPVCGGWHIARVHGTVVRRWCPSTGRVPSVRRPAYRCGGLRLDRPPSLAGVCRGAVQAWERVGRMITKFARTLLRLPVHQYVDDWFAVERCAACLGLLARRPCGRSACRLCCAEHAMNCLARLVRALLGSTAVANRKLEYGASLLVLGIVLTPGTDSYRCELSAAKAAKCIATIEKALEVNELLPGTAQKLAGRLSWACQFLFQRVGRAMLRPLFQRAHSGYVPPLGAHLWEGLFRAARVVQADRSG